MERLKSTVLAAGLLLASAALKMSAQDVDMHNPVGIAGIFNGNVSTGCSYDPLSHSARREVTDIVVPGSIGKYPLKMTRYYNSRHQLSGAMGPGWSFEYSWGLSTNGSKLTYANGNVLDKWCQQPVGVFDKWQTGPVCYGDGCDGDFRLSDGGTVHFGNGRVDAIDDPYGQTTTISYAGDLSWMKVMEPGGRYLLFTYNGPSGRLSRVEAHGLGNITVTDWVNYHYDPVSPGGNGASVYCLTRVDYSDSSPNLGDNTHAHYTYTEDNVRTQDRVLPLLATASDNRYHGPMRQIAYDYQTGSNAPHGAITSERFSAGGALVSRITPGATSCTSFDCTMESNFTETRGDGPSRTFHYTDLHYYSNPQEPGCPEVQYPQPPSQFLLSYTDFKNQTTTLDYDANWYVKSVKDANNHTTYYTRGANIGEITQITHPDTTHIDYTYYGEGTGYISGHYLKQVTDERRNVTYHYRDGNYRITRTDHKDNQNPPNIIAYEEFTYTNPYTNNPLGLLLTHHLPSNASWSGPYVHFQYDSRGLLIAKTNPTTIADWSTALNQAPKTTYTYYTASDGKVGWIDRVKTMTLPANGQGLRESETYEYDLSPGNYSRGLVTKITHNDGSNSYKSFGYDVYGNKLWEKNEMLKQTSYTYDEYNRLLTVKDPIGQTTGRTTSYTYNPTNGMGNRLSHTTSNPDTVTTPAGILTTNIYDANFRKGSTTVGSATTQFGYDNVGNLTDVTDPRLKVTHNGYDNRNRKTSTTEAYQTPLAATTVWHYDPASNIQQIDRPDGQHEWKGYDALNRMIWHKVQRQIPNTNPVQSEDLVTGFGYWPSGKLLWVQDPNHWGGGPDAATYFGYNESDQMNLMYYPGRTEYQQWTYDDAHNLASRTTVHGEVQSFTYDIRNRKISMSWSNGADSASFAYYADGRLQTASNPNSTITRSYDNAGRLASDQQTVTGLGAKNVTYPLYDDDGRVKQIQSAGVYDYTFSYDGIGRFEKIISGGFTAFRYEYDLASNVTHRYSYLPNSVTIDQYTPRDSLNRISGRWIYKNGTAFAAQGYIYDHMNRLGKVDWGSVFDWFGYYWDGELAASVYSVPEDGPEQPDAGQDPDLDTDGSADPWAGYQAPEVAEPEHTPPPPRGRPTPYPRPTPSPLPPTPTPSSTPPPSTPPPSALVYVYDGTGNRLWMADDVNGGKDYVPNDLNQYTSITGSTISNGNEHEINSYGAPGDPQAVSYSYINDEHLKQVTAGGITYTLAYDALGRCVKRTLSANVTYPLSPTTYYIYDGEKPILEYNGANVARNVYGQGIDEILMRTDPTVNGGQPFYYGQDHEGSVTHLLDGNPNPPSPYHTGEVIESYQYDAFGAVRKMWDRNGRIDHTTLNNRFLFTGREYAATYQNTYVPAFKFYEYRARAYNPMLGRFMSEDPKLFDAGDYNLFRYCHNDPIDLTDPMGLAGETTGLLQSGTHDRVWDMNDRAYNFIMGLMQRQFNSAISAGVAGYSAWSAWSAQQALQQMTASFRAEVRNAIGTGARFVQLGNNVQAPRTVSGSGSLAIDTDGVGADHGDPTHRNVTSYQPGGRSLNADTDPYVAVPTRTMRQGVRAGDRAILSGNGRSAPGVVGDFGSPGWGEASVAMVRGIGIRIRDVPRIGPVPDTPGGRPVPVTITVYPSRPPEP